ncbi:MAG: FAD-binding oxidoreductase, partial [Spirillospora sp.]
DRRAGDLAVLTLRPERPLPFRAGQHVTVQTPRWPRVWRPYWIANAPRPDGTLRLHVRALPGGWVSGALVRHTAPGDTVLLGPATGPMALDPRSERGLLLIGGGTGLAPMKALAEQAVTTGVPGRDLRAGHGHRAATARDAARPRPPRPARRPGRPPGRHGRHQPARSRRKPVVAASAG